MMMVRRENDANIFPISQKVGKDKIVDRSPKKLVLYNTEDAFEKVDENKYPVSASFLGNESLLSFPKN